MFGHGTGELEEVWFIHLLFGTSRPTGRADIERDLSGLVPTSSAEPRTESGGAVFEIRAFTRMNQASRRGVTTFKPESTLENRAHYPPPS